jgi:alkylation response protein AidB-like acyl-CoA dehydrogenase
VAREEELLSYAEAAQPFLREHRALTEAERRIPTVIAESLMESGVCRMALTRDVGGLETDPVVFCRVIEALAWAESSVAWIVWNNALPCLMARFLQPPAREELFRDPRTLLASSTRPTGKAVVEDGGYRVSGRWSLVSGCQLADWLPMMAVVMDGDRPRMAASENPDTRLLIVPRGSYAIIDTWHVSGLRGTGSHDVEIHDVFVPEERSFSWLDDAVDDRPFNRLPIFPLMAAGCASICIGVAQSALDAFREIVETKVQADPTPSLKARDDVLASIATSEFNLEASRQVIHDALADIRDASLEGRQVTPAMRARLWRATTVTGQQAKAVIGDLHTRAGTPALYVDSPLERAQRDILAITQHVVLQPLHLANAGRASLGLPVESPIF